ncbi:hypothetical protein, partial [Sporosarcina sp. P29]|uniref:hypothetical protein n=1 Tax=Sporosarcina sp. P29 TaxID=2048252 RepID=UPI001E643A73
NQFNERLRRKYERLNRLLSVCDSSMRNKKYYPLAMHGLEEEPLRRTAFALATWLAYRCP